MYREERTHPRKSTLSSNEGGRVKQAHERDLYTRRGKKEGKQCTPVLHALRNENFFTRR